METTSEILDKTSVLDILLPERNVKMTIRFEGKEYPAKEIFLNDEIGTVTISVDSLDDALTKAQIDARDEDRCRVAESVDNLIFFYVPDGLIGHGDNEIRQFILESI